MKKTSFIALPVFLLALVTFASINSNEWSQKMMNFINPVMQIYSLDLNKPTFDEKDKEKLAAAIKDLNNTSHGLKFSFMNFFSKKDPAVKAEYDQFKHNLDMAEKMLAVSPKQSIFYVRSAIGQCASCHSKGGKATHLFALFENTNIPQTEKGRLALAIRDYQASTDIFKSILLDPSLQNDYFRMNDILVSYINSAILSGYTKNQILEDLKKVQSTAKNKGTQNDLKNLIQDVESAKTLNSFDDAIKAFKTYSKDLYNLEKSMYTSLHIKNLLHEKLNTLKTNEQKSVAYEVLGDIYGHFPEISIFMVPENYYELCVKTSPKTKLANECFEKYKNKIILGYSGSMGSNVPEYEKVKIENLKKLTSM